MEKKVNNNQHQQLTVKKQQQEFCDLFGLKENVIWDLYKHDQRFELESKINIIIQSPVNDKRELKRISKIRNNIIDSLWDQRKYSGGSLLMSPIIILAVNYKTWINSQKKILNETNFEIYTVFRIRKCIDVDERNGNDCCMIFVDENARVYQDWDDYKSSNTIPKRVIVAPRKGIYQTKENNEVLLEIFESPACSITQTVLNVADTSSTFGGLGASVLFLANLISLPIAAPVISLATTIGRICAGYTTLRSGGGLIDRAKHNQSNNPINEPEARGHWIGVAGGAAAVVAGGASTGLGKLAQGGSRVAPVVEKAVNVINASALAVNGFGISNGVITFITRYRNEENIGALDILQLSTSLFLFTHSVNNFQTASNIIRANQEQIMTDYSKTLSNRQRKAFIKAAKETVRLQGGSEGRTQIIRSMNNIPDKEAFFGDLNRVNKNLNENNVRTSFNGRDEILLNNAETVRPGDLKNILKTSAAIEGLKSKAPIPEGQLKNVKHEINLINPIPVQNEMQRIIACNIPVSNEEELGAQAEYLQKSLSNNAYISVLEFVKFFYKCYGQKINKQLMHIVPFENCLSKTLAVIQNSAKKLGQEFSEYVENFLSDKTNYQKLSDSLLDNYRLYIPKGNLIGKCHKCHGKYYINFKL